MAHPENAQAFVDRLAGDPALREKVVSQEISLESIIVLAQTLGYRFTGVELKRALEGYISKNGGSVSAPLSDEQLGSIAGGVLLLPLLRDFARTIGTVEKEGRPGR